MSDEHTDNAREAARFDPFVRGLAIGAAVVLLGFLIMAAVVYFSSDYHFASVLDGG